MSANANPPRHHDPNRFPTTFQHQAPFSAVLIGTGCPEYNPSRSGPSTLIHYEGQYFLVDMGPGTQVQLIKAGIGFHDIETMMFTHHHLDHNEEYMPLAVNAWMQGRRHAHLVGPAGTRDLHDFMLRFYGEDLRYRAKRTGSSLEGMFEGVDITEVEGEEDLEINGVAISSTEVPHVVYTLAYRFDAGGQSIVVSGDLSYSENLIRLAQGADLLVMDSGGVIMVGGQVRQPPPIQMGEAIVRPHPNLDEVARMAASAGVKKMVLTHFRPGDVDEEATRREISKTFGGEILMGQDLMEIAA